MGFDVASLGEFVAHYPGEAATLRHDLADHPLFALDRLITLACALPESSVEYNSGDLPLTQDPAQTPMNGLSVEETVRRIAENKSWIVLKNIEQDADYAALLKSCLSDVSETVHAKTGAMHKCEGFIFVSSPGSVTPFHMDPEHNILMQVAGTKSFHIFPTGAKGILSAAVHEAFHKPGGHRNLQYKEDYEGLARAVEMAPGDALYAPVKAPHWVKVGNAVSVSLSVTWRSRFSDAEARLHRGNGWLRNHGLTPPAPGVFPMRDRCVRFGTRLAARFSR